MGIYLVEGLKVEEEGEAKEIRSSSFTIYYYRSINELDPSSVFVHFSKTLPVP
jgi:hypothetical protein